MSFAVKFREEVLLVRIVQQLRLVLDDLLKVPKMCNNTPMLKRPRIVVSSALLLLVYRFVLHPSLWLFLFLLLNVSWVRALTPRILAAHNVVDPSSSCIMSSSS